MMDQPRLSVRKLILFPLLIAAFVLMVQMIVYEKMDSVGSTRSERRQHREDTGKESQLKKRRLQTMITRKVVLEEEYAQLSNTTSTRTFDVNVEDQPKNVTKKKNLILHGGPGKMATTTVQNAIRKDLSLLREDGYCTFDMRRFVWGRSTVESITRNSAWKDLQAKMDECHELNLNVILSCEGMFSFQQEVWYDLLEPLFSRWNIVQLVGYRRYYDWKASLYGQQMNDHGDHFYKTGINGQILNKGADTMYTYKNMQKFKRLLLHEKYYPEITAQEVKDQKLGEQNPNKYKFIIYNLHQDPNVLKTLYCDVIPQTDKTCEKYSNEMPRHDNKAVPVEYLRLINAGIKEKKLIDLEVSPKNLKTHKVHLAKDLEKMWEESWNKTIMDFPRTCIPKEKLRDLLDKSMAFEELLVPDFYEKETKPHLAELEQEFYDTANTKWCSFQLDRILNEEEYKYVWDGLNDIISGKNIE